MRFLNDQLSFMLKDTSSSPNLYRDPFINMKGVTLIEFLFLFIERPSGAFPFYKKWTVSTNSSGNTLTLNRCALGNSSSISIGSLLVYILDRWYGPTFMWPGHTMTSNSNS